MNIHSFSLVSGVCSGLPMLYSQDGLGNQATVYVKFFTPDSNWTWYASEAATILADGSQMPVKNALAQSLEIKDVLFFGLVVGLDIELGYFVLSNLRTIRGSLGLPVECEIYFKPQTIEAARDYHNPYKE